MASKQKRERINLETKYRIIQEVQKKTRYKEIVDLFGLRSKQNITRILQKKSKIIEAFEQNKNCTRKSLKSTLFEEIETELKHFYGSVIRKVFLLIRLC